LIAALISSSLNIRMAPDLCGFVLVNEKADNDLAFYGTKHAPGGLSLIDQSIRNPKRKRVANKDRKSAADSRNDSLAPRAASHGSRRTESALP
jgi:hypothetical protein